MAGPFLKGRIGNRAGKRRSRRCPTCRIHGSRQKLFTAIHKPCIRRGKYSRRIRGLRESIQESSVVNALMRLPDLAPDQDRKSIRGYTRAIYLPYRTPVALPSQPCPPSPGCPQSGAASDRRSIHEGPSWLQEYTKKECPNLIRTLPHPGGEAGFGRPLASHLMPLEFGMSIRYQASVMEVTLTSIADLVISGQDHPVL